MINSIKKLSNRLSKNNYSTTVNSNNEEESTTATTTTTPLNSSGVRDINRSNVGYLIVSLLFSCISEKDIKLKEVNSFVKQIFDYYHLSNYQINQLYETHSQSNYLYQIQQQKLLKQHQIELLKNKDQRQLSSSLPPLSSYSPPTFSSSFSTSPKPSILNVTYDFELYNKQFINQLSNFSNESKLILKEIQDFCDAFKRDLKLYIDELEKTDNNDDDDESNDFKLERYIEERGDYYQHSMSTFLQKLVNLFPKEDVVAMSEAIESLVLIQTYGQIFPLNKSRDKLLKNIIQFAKQQPISEYIDITQERLDSVNWDAAVADLSLINLFETPRDKVMCVLRAARHISKGLQKLNNQPFGADEFIGYLIYLTIQTNPSYLYSNLKFIELFRSSDLMVSEEGYYFISLKMATEYIESKFKDQYLKSTSYQQELELQKQQKQKQDIKVDIFSDMLEDGPKYNTIIDSIQTSNNNPIESPLIQNTTTNANVTNTTTTTPQVVLNDPLMDFVNNSIQDDDDLYEIDDSDELLIQDIVDHCDEILKNITSLAISSGYDSFVRSTLKRFSIKLSPSTLGLKLLLLENSLGQKLLSEIQEKQIEKENSDNPKKENTDTNTNTTINTTNTTSTIKNNIMNVFERTRSNHRILKVAIASIAGGGLLAITGGLVAPLIGAVALHSAIGVSILSAIATTGVSGTAITSILFGAAGASISAGRMTKHTSGLKEFQYSKVNGSIGLHVVIGALGWVEEKGGAQDYARWESNLFSGVLCLGEVYSLKWETSQLYKLYKSLNDYKKKVEDNSTFSRFTTKMMHDAILPSASLLQASAIISTNWGKVKDRSIKAGKLLADEIIQCKAFGRRPITLVGISMGARVMYYCLLELVDKKAYGHIENVLLIGAPVPNNPDKWRKIRKIVSGRVVNCYSSSDILLQYVYESNKNITDDSNSFMACGTSPINSNNNINNKQSNSSSSNNNSMFPFKFNYNDNSNNNNNNTAGSSISTSGSINIPTPKIESFSNINKKNIKGHELKELYNNKTKFYLDLIEDVDVSSVITSHLDYQKDHVQRMILSHVNIESIESCKPILMVTANTILQLEESMKQQQQHQHSNNKNEQKDDYVNDSDSDSDSDSESDSDDKTKMDVDPIKSPIEMSVVKEEIDFTIDDVPLSKMKF